MQTTHTPGPWRWEVNEKHKEVELCGGEPRYDKTVMSFERWGMQGAQPYFADKIDGFELRPAKEFAIEAPGRCHHANWFKVIDHPDALLIQSAPELLNALIKCQEIISEKCECISYLHPIHKIIQSAIDQATGKGKIDSKR